MDTEDCTNLFVIADSMEKNLINLLSTKIVLVDDDSSDDEIESECMKQLQGRNKPTRVENFTTQTIPNFSDRQFQEHFRLSSTSFERCLQMCSPLLKKTCVDGRLGTDVRLQLLSVIWILATPDSFRSVSDRFDVGKSTLHDSFVRVITVLNKLSPTVISWPKVEEIKNNK